MITILGAGLLGAGMAENLLNKGERVTVWNRTPAKVAPLVALGATAAPDPRSAAAGASRIHLVLTSDDAVDAVIAAMGPTDAWVIDHSTNLPARVRARTERLWAEGVRYVHVPVFMGPKNARDATGLMLHSAPKAVADAIAGPLAAMTGQVWHCGDRPDLAAAYKLIGNGAFVGITGLVGDLFAVGAGAGMSPDEVLALFSVFNPGSTISWIGERVIAAPTATPSFELPMARKDVRLMLETAGESTIVLSAVAAAMDQALAEGLTDKDYAIFARPRG
jgi:3-hydroxyisobutyrate dehydrogenase-like beta-hydroxyacid dehydrogenase